MESSCGEVKANHENMHQCHTVSSHIGYSVPIWSFFVVNGRIPKQVFLFTDLSLLVWVRARRTLKSNLMVEVESNCVRKDWSRRKYSPSICGKKRKRKKWCNNISRLYQYHWDNILYFSRLHFFWISFFLLFFGRKVGNCEERRI